MKNLLKLGLLLIIVPFWHNCSNTQPGTTIVISSKANGTDSLAAKELRRYIYVCSGHLLPIITSDSIDLEMENIIVGSKKSMPLNNPLLKKISKNIASLTPQDYLIQTLNLKNLIIAGGDDAGLLYGTYRFIETLGVRFYPDGDVLPSEKTDFTIRDISIQGKPLFSLRGIQPFHDFPEGPDWWTLDDYKAIIAQLPKMGMNFFGLHTYPETKFGGFSKTEPVVWIGQKDQINEDGTVKTAYPAMHFNTLDSTWGYSSCKTSDFGFGASALFDVDYFGGDYMKGFAGWPHTDKENIQIFNSVGNLLGNSFAFAHKLGVKTCIGTETPLTIPSKVKELLRSQGKDPESDAVKQEVYEGIFTRILKTTPIDYYWVWTPEGWTWEGEKDADVKRTQLDITNALAALHKIGNPFTLATCGWVLGPSKDRALFDRYFPKEMPFSCINREVGFTPIEPGFKAVSDRPKWAIPWLEDDPNLAVPQLWAGRVRRDAVDAYNYGCTGLFGIHWRTKPLGPAFGALAKAGWELGDWKNNLDTSKRDLPVADFYDDWAQAQFGKEVGNDLGRIFANLDGGPLYRKGQNERTGNIPRVSDWLGTGPGGVKPNPKSWENEQHKFAFVDSIEKYTPKIRGADNQERFAYWLNMFKYTRSMGEVGCLLGAIDSAIHMIGREKDLQKQKIIITENIIPLRKETTQKWGEMVGYLLQSVSTTGELGTIANLEQHSLLNLKTLNKYDSLLSTILNKPIEPITFGKTYNGAPRLIIPTKRTLIEANENFNLKIMVLSIKAPEILFYWRSFGSKEFETIPVKHIARGVYQILIPAATIAGNDFEYYIEADTGNEKLYFPASAPIFCQTIIVN